MGWDRHKLLWDGMEQKNMSHWTSLALLKGSYKMQMFYFTRIKKLNKSPLNQTKKHDNFINRSLKGCQKLNVLDFVWRMKVRNRPNKLH